MGEMVVEGTRHDRAAVACVVLGLVNEVSAGAPDAVCEQRECVVKPVQALGQEAGERLGMLRGGELLELLPHARALGFDDVDRVLAPALGDDQLGRVRLAVAFDEPSDPDQVIWW